MRAIAAAAALVSFGIAAWISAHYPITRELLLGVLTVWTLVAYVRPALWLLVVPALLPITGFASWTGWLIFEELDILVFGAAAGGYARLAFSQVVPLSPQRHSARVSPISIGLIALFGISTAFGIYRGIVDAGGFHFDWLQGYHDPLNSVRLGKSFALAVLLLPLLLVQLRQSGERATELLGAGLTAGLFATSLAAFWERLAFPGLLDFSPDYRTTALFWEMHVGGAALDGFLALTVPFAFRELLRASSPSRWLLAAALIAAATYACLTTFSRGVYLAIPLSLALLALLLTRQKNVARAPFAFATMAKLIFFGGAIAALSYLVFQAGGYRTLTAVLAAFAVSLPLGSAARHVTLSGWVIALGAGGLLSVASIAAGPMFSKAPYYVFVVAFFACALLIYVHRRYGGKRCAVAAVGTYVWLLIAATQVAMHWGGTRALRDTAIVLVAMLGLTVWNARTVLPLWAANTRRQAGVIGSAMLIAGATAVLSGGTYMVNRFSDSERDLAGRVQHWRDGLELLESPADWILGKGLGRFPASYYFGVRGNEFPGSYALRGKEDGEYLILSGPRHSLGFHELFRVSQRVAILPGTAHSISLDARAAGEVELHLEVCEKHLLYHGGCLLATVPVKPNGTVWQRIDVAFDGRAIGGGPWYAPRLAFLSVALDTQGRLVEIDNVRLIGPDGRNLIANGDFSRGRDQWFFTSDRHHLPWHIKSVALHLVFDQGVVGFFLFLMLIGAALWRLIAGGARTHPAAPFLASALVGFLAVGVFDSLLDVPRLAFVFYLLVLLSLVLKKPVTQEEAGATRGSSQPARLSEVRLRQRSGGSAADA